MLLSCQISYRTSDLYTTLTILLLLNNLTSTVYRVWHRYLTAAPFNLTPSGVGVVFGLVSIVDSVSAVLTGAWSLLVSLP